MRVCLCLLLSTTALFPLAVMAAEQDRHGAVEEVLVTSRPYEQDADRALQAGSVVSGEELARRLEGTLGETLNGLPGVSSSYFGPAASRPVIRGLSGDRVRVLSGGIGSFDAASVSPDHAVALDPLTAERIEIVRGPGTLLYGGAAVGGVINVFDGRIPSRLPDNGAEGAVRAAYGTAADERAADGAVTAALGSWAVHADASYRNSDDLDIPGFAESKRLQEAEEIIPDPATRGRLRNSAAKSSSGALGLSYIADDGYLGVSYSRNDMTYGVPGEDGVDIDLNQDRFDLMGELQKDFLIFEKAKIRFGYGDYDHSERENGVAAMTFFNKSWEGRLELVQQSGERLKGAVGLQISRRDFSAVGEESVLPPSITNSWGVFAVEQMTAGDWTMEGGVRLERQTTKVEPLARDRAFNTFSISAGVSRNLGARYQIGLTATRAERAPSAEELYYNGPHEATGTFEVGNPDLKKETVQHIELSLRKKSGRLTGALSLYYSRFSDFVYEAATGAEEDGLPVFAFNQADATFQGGEAELNYLAYEKGSFTLTFDVAADVVRASLTNNGGPLPRIPPKSLTVGIAAQGAWYDARIEVEMADKQSRVTAYELPTDGYALLNMNVNVHPFAREDVTLSLRARNLINTEARSHTSFLKDRAPLAGRDVRASVTYRY